jgi:hypothetical protein
MLLVNLEQTTTLFPRRVFGGSLTGVEIPFQEYGQHKAALSNRHNDCLA